MEETGSIRICRRIFESVMFLGLNFICYLVVLVCYVEIIRTFCKSSKRAGRNPKMKEQIRLTSRVLAIVFTDFACWFPIIVIGILVQVGVLTLPPGVFAWCVTFVLPINSAINPYLYTIVSVVSERRKQTKSQKKAPEGLIHQILILTLSQDNF